MTTPLFRGLTAFVLFVLQLGLLAFAAILTDAIAFDGAGVELLANSQIRGTQAAAAVSLAAAAGWGIGWRAHRQGA